MQTAIDKDESKTIEIKEESPMLKEESFYCEETFKVESLEQAHLVQNLTQEIKAAVDVFNQSSKKRIKDQSNVSEQDTECKDLTFKSFSGSARQKRKSIWEDEEPSMSSDNAAESEKIKLRRMSAEILSTYTLFSQGQTRSATEESSASVPKYDKDFATATQTTKKVSESTAEVPANSTWVYRHKSVFDFAKSGNKPPDQLPSTYFSSGTKSPSLFSNSLLNSPWGKKSEATSTDLLKYNLLSRSNSDGSSSSMTSYNTSEQSSTSTTYNTTTKPSFHFTQIPSIKEKSMDIYECGADRQNTSGNTEDKKEKSLSAPQALSAIDTGARKGPVSNTIIHTPETTFHPDDKDSLPQSDIEVKKEEAENSVNSTDADISPAEHYNVHIKAAQFPGGKTNSNECPSVKIEPADYLAQDQDSASTNNIWATKEISPELLNLFKGKDKNTSLLS